MDKTNSASSLSAGKVCPQISSCSAFNLKAPWQPTGDQPAAIRALTDGLRAGDREQSLMGVTGSGKTFTMANIIAQINRPTLVLAHNKILAAQLCGEFKEFFPDNAVEYFVSYYDYYQPEAYIPGTDTFIEKDSAINDEIDRLRHSATFSLAERNDVIIVASVSCIFSMGSVEEYRNNVVSLRKGMEVSRDAVMRKLVGIQYQRNDINFVRNKFRVRGDVLEIFPAAGWGGGLERAIRVEFFGDEIERISEIEVVTGNTVTTMTHVVIFPATHYVINEDGLKPALVEIAAEMHERVEHFTANHRLIEAQRIAERTTHDMEMLREIGMCKGIENYSRILAGRPPGSTPITLLDHFPEDSLLLVDESHVTLPQVRGMFGGDAGRKRNLIDYGFRLPSAYDNRPLNFEEFHGKVGTRFSAIYVSATPGVFEREHSARIAEQVIRPTGLLDPIVTVKPVEGQIEDLLSEINKRAEAKQRVLVTTLTKKMAEDLTFFLKKFDVRAVYMHCDIDTMERMEIIRDLRLGEFDVLVGINLLREGLDLPEVSLVAILDADKEGFLRSETSLVQTIGRAARNADGEVIMYADSVTRSMEAAIRETARRRELQQAYNTQHGIVPQTIIKKVLDVLEISKKDEIEQRGSHKKKKKLTKSEREDLIKKYTALMKEAAKVLDFETAAYYRDAITAIDN
jgi:excinuclease ABC subunit B